jgi:succinyl-diaminopimelate desuccinylase
MLAAMPFAQCRGFEYICALNRIFPHGDYYGEALGIKMSDEVSGELTLNFGVVEYEPTKISGNFDSRTPQCADAVDILGISTAELASEGFSVGTADLAKSHVTGADTPFVQLLLSVYEQYTGEPGECLAIGGSTYVHGIPGGVVFGCGMPGENNNVHGPNEFIDKEQLLMSAKMFAQVIIEMCA